MADHDRHAKPVQPGRAVQAKGHHHPSDKSVARRDHLAADRIAKIEKAVRPAAFAKASKNHLSAAHILASRKSEAAKTRS